MAKTIPVLINTKVPVGTGRAFYLGNIGAITTNTYTTGGSALEEGTGSRYKIPGKIDAIFNLAGGCQASWVPSTELVKLQLNGTTEGSVEAQFGSAKEMKGVLPEGTGVIILGDG